MNRFLVFFLFFLLLATSGAAVFKARKAHFQLQVSTAHWHECSQQIRQGTNALQELRGFALVYLLTGSPTFLQLADQKARETQDFLGKTLGLQIPPQAKEALDQIPGLLGKLMDRLHDEAFPHKAGSTGAATSSPAKISDPGDLSRSLADSTSALASIAIAISPSPLPEALNGTDPGTCSDTGPDIGTSTVSPPAATDSAATDSAATDSAATALTPGISGAVLNADCALIASLFGTAQNWIDIVIEDSLK